MIKMFSFGKRVVRAMNYTRQISLPKDWLRFHKLDAGSEVELLLTEEGDLVVTTIDGKGEAEIDE